MVKLPYTPDEVGHRIKRLREAMGLSGAELARLLDVKPQEVSAWETGVRRPSIAKALPLVQHYQITLDWLFLGDPSALPYQVAQKLFGPLPEASRRDRG